MNSRKQQLLKNIVETYAKNAEPVSSSLLAENFNLSPATLRNEMVELEKDGYVFQPHISAGRVPSEDGYRYYVENFLDKNSSGDLILKKNFEQILNLESDQLRKIKELAKKLAEASRQTVLIGFAPNDVYYTGISNLFSKPEFSNPEIVYNLSLIIDHLDQVMAKVYDDVNDKVEILIGRDNPFDQNCSVLLTDFKNQADKAILGLLGPTRMDYQHNYNLLTSVKKLLNQS